MYKHFFKRFLDLFITIFALLLIGWVLLLIALWLHFANKGAGAFFYQERVGRGEKTFNIIKFKSMTDECDENGELLPDSQRLTTVGRFVRKTSIDELPQLLNILKGDMSFIGPRPLPSVYLPYYTDEEAHRHDVRPGISGWAQVNGRKNITWPHKLECDAYYVKHISLALDLKICWMTVRNVLKREDVGLETSGCVSLYDIRGIQRPKYAEYDPDRDSRPTNTNVN